MIENVSKLLVLIAVTCLSSCIFKQDKKIVSPRIMPIYNQKYLKLSEQNLQRNQQENIVTYNHILNYSEEESMINDLIRKNDEKLRKSEAFKDDIGQNNYQIEKHDNEKQTMIDPIIDPKKDFVKELSYEVKKVKPVVIKPPKPLKKSNMKEITKSKVLPKKLPEVLKENKPIINKVKEPKISSTKKSRVPNKGISLKQLMEKDKYHDRNHKNKEPIKLLPLRKSRSRSVTYMMDEKHDRYIDRSSHANEVESNREFYRDVN